MNKYLKQSIIKLYNKYLNNKINILERVSNNL